MSLDGFVAFNYTCHSEILHYTLPYLLRRALREVGFKIRKWETIFDTDYAVHEMIFRTNIPNALWEEKLKLYNEWTTEVCDDFHPDSDTETTSECDEESESEETDPVA